jgi:hypothetical protein
VTSEILEAYVSPMAIIAAIVTPLVIRNITFTALTELQLLFLLSERDDFGLSLVRKVEIHPPPRWAFL